MIALACVGASAGCAVPAADGREDRTTYHVVVLDKTYDLAPPATAASFSLTFPEGTREARFSITFSGLAPGYTMELGGCADTQVGQSFPGTAEHALTCSDVEPGKATARISIQTGTLEGRANVTALVDPPE